jgi:hypothetical protein
VSKAKFEATRELIREKKYEEARILLQLMANHPTAQKWLTRLDEIDPPFPQAASSAPPPTIPVLPPQQSVLYQQMMTPQSSEEQQQFYDRENRRASRRSIGAGIRLIVIGILALCALEFLASPQVYPLTGYAQANIGMGIWLLPVGLVAIVSGLYRIIRHKQ